MHANVSDKRLKMRFRVSNTRLRRSVRDRIVNLENWWYKKKNVHSIYIPVLLHSLRLLNYRVPVENRIFTSMIWNHFQVNWNKNRIKVLFFYVFLILSNYLELYRAENKILDARIKEKLKGGEFYPFSIIRSTEWITSDFSTGRHASLSRTRITKNTQRQSPEENVHANRSEWVVPVSIGFYPKRFNPWKEARGQRYPGSTGWIAATRQPADAHKRIQIGHVSFRPTSFRI